MPSPSVAVSVTVNVDAQTAARNGRFFVPKVSTEFASMRMPLLTLTLMVAAVAPKLRNTEAVPSFAMRMEPGM